MLLDKKLGFSRPNTWEELTKGMDWQGISVGNSLSNSIA